MNKYNAQPTVIDGIRFASKKEANRYCELKLLERAGKIKNLELQPRFKLHAGIVYIGDFAYLEDGKTIIEDTKGVETAVFKLKKKLFEADYPELELRIVK